jgi:hypothetical protein
MTDRQSWWRHSAKHPRMADQVLHTRLSIRHPPRTQMDEGIRIGLILVAAEYSRESTHDGGIRCCTHDISAIRPGHHEI